MNRVYHHIYPTEYGLKIAEQQKDRLYSKITDKLEYIPNIVQKKQTELWTLKKLQNDCQSLNDETNILYIHTKGATKPTIEREQWREYMERELIDNYKFHLDILKKGFSSSGVLMGIPYWSSKIYGGNFWWTTAGYIKTLPNDLGWGDWDLNTTEVPSRTKFGYWISWAELKFINQGQNYNPYNVSFFKIDGMEQFVSMIKKEMEKNETIFKNETTKTII